MTSKITLIVLLLATTASAQTVIMLQPTTSQTLSSPVTVTCTNSTPESWINFYLDNTYKASSPPYTQTITATPGNHTFKCSGYHGASILDGTASASVTITTGPTPSTTPTTPTPTPTPTPYTSPTPTSTPTPIPGTAKPFAWRWSYSTQNKTLLSGGRWQQNCSMPRTWNYPLWIETQTDSLLCNTGTGPVTFNYGVGVTCPSEVSLPMRPYVSMSHPDYTNVPLAAGQCMKFNLNRIDAAVTPDGNTPLTPPVNLLPASSGCYPAPALVIQLVTGMGPLNIQSDELMLGTPLTIGNLAARKHKATAHRKSLRYSQYRR